MIAYQFAQLFYMHDATSGEVATIGLAMWVQESQRLLTFVTNHYGRLSAFWADFSGSGYGQMIRNVRSHFARISEHTNAAQQSIFRHPEEARFTHLLHTLIPDDGSCFRWSSIMGGITEDVDIRFEQLQRELILKHESRSRKRTDESDIAHTIEDCLGRYNVLARLDRDIKIVGQNYDFSFKLGWQNGVRQVLEPLSLDYLAHREMADKANIWCGRLLSLSRNTTTPFKMIGVVSKPPCANENGLLDGYHKALEILTNAPSMRKIISEEDVASVVPIILQDMVAVTN